MLKFLIVLQLFYVLNTGTSINSKHGMDEETKADFIASSRTRRQANDPKDPYTIVNKQCIEYSKARYLGSKIVSPETRPKLNCVTPVPIDASGAPARLKEFPHMALIGYNNKNDDIKKVDWGCAGTLISDRYVLSAAHCFSENFIPKWVRLGELVVNDEKDLAEPKDYRIAERILHPQFNRSLGVQHDIMLLKLSEPVTFTPHIRPICLYPSKDIASSYNNAAIMSGWGKISVDEPRSDELFKVKVDFLQDSKCTSYYGKDKRLPKGFDSSSMICVGDKNGVESCRADSGSPLQIPMKDWSCMYWQVGISSYGPFICGQKDVPSIYTKVSNYIPWIQSIVWP